jgi:polysaccharide chain length determinant protein (PEP-CTERM system associated)
MQEALALLFTYVWGAWRHRWLALSVAWVIAIGGWIWVWQLPEAYVAKARISVDSNTVLRPLLRGMAIQPDINQRLTLMSRTLLSRPNLEKLMRMTDLDLEVSTDRQKEELLSSLGEAISLSGERDNASLYYISVKNKDRDNARRIAQALITVFIESSLGDKRTDSSEAQSFLEQQILEYEKRLVSAEKRLAQFKQSNVDMLPGSGGDYYSRLESAKASLNGARLQLREMENRQQELARQVAGEDPVFISTGVTVTSSGIMSPLDTRIQSLRFRVDDLLTRYTDKHPEVRQINALIAELEGEKVIEYTQLREEPGSGLSGFSNSPVYQGMRSMLAATAANVAELRVREAEYQKRVIDLEGKVNSIPETEAQFKQLDRDYSVISSQHQQLLQRREQARLSGDMEQNASDVVFRVIDPPFVPSKPSEPNKIMLNSGVLVVALGAGVGLSLLLFLLSPVIGNAHMLVSVTGLPMLGSVTFNQSPVARRSELYGLLSFGVCSVGLVLIFIGLSLGQGSLFA